MRIRSIALAVSLLGCTSSVWAATSNVDVYGTIQFPPAYATYSAAADIASDFLTGGLYTPHFDIRSLPGETANISVSGPSIPSIPSTPFYTAAARTTLGSNHAYSSANTLPLGTLAAISYSGWYDAVTVTGGNGTGIMHFSVQLNGTVDAGAIAGIVGYGLYASSVHPTQLANGSIINYAPLPTNPWFLLANEVTPITGHTIGVSPYNDTSILFTTEIQPFPDGVQGIPSLEISKTLVDQVLVSGPGQNINLTLHGTLNFTYGETFYLISGLGTGVDDIQTFCAFSIDSACTPPPKDGTGATTLDFSNSANLVGIVLPEGATASFASGNDYNVTAVPEPGEWLMMLAGLGLVAWRARRRNAVLA